MTKNKSFHSIIVSSSSLHEESDGQEQLVGKVESCEGSVVNKTLNNRVETIQQTMFYDDHLEDALNIVVIMENGEDMTVGQDDTGVMNQGGPRHQLVPHHLHHVLHTVHRGHVDHHLQHKSLALAPPHLPAKLILLYLRILFMICRVKQVDIFSDESSDSNIAEEHEHQHLQQLALNITLSVRVKSEILRMTGEEEVNHWKHDIVDDTEDDEELECGY